VGVPIALIALVLAALPTTVSGEPAITEPASAWRAPVLLAQRPRRPEAEQPQEVPAPPEPQPAGEPPRPAPSEPQDKPPGFAGPAPSRPTPTRTSPDFVPILDRWRLGFPNWNRYERPIEAPFVKGRWWDPYNQNVLKGDYPVIGQRYFLNVSAISDSLLELRRIPLPSNVSAADPGQAEFFGSGDQIFFNQNFILSLEFFKGDTAFKPRDWEFRVTPVFNLNYLSARETGVVNIDVREGTTRLDGHVSLQEFLVEYHLGDLSPHYDFVSTRFGIQPFTSDFRGFIFSDNQLGFRLFGNLGSNRHQFNLVYFRPLEKDTNSGLNRLFDTRQQHLGIANYFFQDFIWSGYTLMFNAHYLRDSGDKHFDENGFLVRPAAIGTLDTKVVDAVWLGWNGDGHIGPLNLTHAFYQVLGRESRNPITGRSEEISAQMAALELSTDLDWLRPRASFLWASGDSKPTDGMARGFDTIFDNPNFAGGGFSYWVRQGLPLTNTGLELVGRNSLVPSLRGSKIEGQPNFVNPGLFLFNVGADVELTPKLKAIVNVSYLRFHHTEVLERVLFQPKVRPEIGIDYSLGFRWRPFLIENVVITAGVSALQPGDGLRDVYAQDTFTFGAGGLEKTRGFPYDVLYSAFLAMTFTY
jgi:hypothetical protein